jgi:riboflavin synthase
MFTGIIEEVGEVVRLAPGQDSAVLRIRAGTLAQDVTHGASISVDGVCLTVVGQLESADSQASEAGATLIDLDFDVMGETLRRSVLGSLAPGDRVNLERAALLTGRLDGHIVQGHVDGTGVLLARSPGDAWHSFRFGLPGELARYVAEKGSIAVNGVSLTVSAVGSELAGTDWFEVGLIPETLRATVLGELGVGDQVNLEVDILAKYTERLLTYGRSSNTERNGGN